MKDIKINEDKEKELSMTRSLKFKQLQDDIDKDDNQKTKEIILKKKKIEHTSEIKPIDEDMDNDDVFEDLMSKKEKKKYRESIQDVTITRIDIKKLEKKAARNEKKKNELVNDKEEELFITKSFKPLKKTKKFKKVLMFFLKLIILFLIIFAIGYFFVYPFIVRSFVTPRDVYYHVIDNISDYMINNVNDYDDKINSFNLDINVDSEKYEDLSGYSYNFDYGYDGGNKFLSFNYIKNDVNYGIRSYFVDDNKYLNYSNSNILYDVTLVNEEEYSEYFNNYNEINDLLSNIRNKDDCIYLINMSNEFFKSILKDNFLEKNSDTILINGKDVDVTKNTLTIDSSYLKEIKTAYLEFVLSDERLLSIFADINEMDLSQYKNYINNYVVVVDPDFKMIFNVYTRNGFEFVGIDLSYDGFRTFYYYNYDNNIELYLNASDYLPSKLSIKKFIVLVKGTKINNQYNLRVNYNGRDYADLVVNVVDDMKVDVLYTLLSNGYSGNLLFEDSENSFNLSLNSLNNAFDFKIEYGELDISFVDFEIVESESSFEDATIDFEKRFKKVKFVTSFEEFIQVLNVE
ncbi:MAG: YqkE family protein [Bacilli bacterium]|nr:YqkE family protein [Bacilli bacterium]